MKKLFLLTLLFTTVYAYSQVVATSKSNDLNEVYKGGNQKFVKDVQNNFNNFSSDFQANGIFTLTFDVDKKGNIINPKVSPEADNDFTVALIRSFKRVKNNFSTNTPRKNIAVLLDFRTTFKSDDGRDRFTATPISNSSRQN
ncbi:hypothetical protein [Kaistella jeonii]|uniref:TonB C-terminal domain-containing protein n=1 Tax=Kaistella jeonii TaxID=266749 RepID=A0A0C1FN14_9FLAO|nr:hypothetical protein [Kaistella jeonii]KIA89334.1 hypothetical protein OA86_06990 [Kaistella jeonii]SFC03062.1 hypothetical protein SAMN05421876_105121 [Kaistella jeonii]VEI96653.1 Uncharacterised protein [Kaistella jeonii]